MRSYKNCEFRRFGVLQKRKSSRRYRTTITLRAQTTRRLRTTIRRLTRA